MAEAKAGRAAKEVVGVVVLVVLAAALAIPLGLSLVAFVPIGLILIAIAAIYAAWRHHEASLGHERRGGERAVLIGGSEGPGRYPVQQRVRRPAEWHSRF
jgi:hypothetical protein